MKLDPAALFGPAPLAGRPPTSLKFSADGSRLGFLRPAADDRHRLELWLHQLGGETRRLDIELADAGVADADMDERERRRQFAGGITAWDWHPDGEALFFPHGGRAWLHQIASAATEAVTPATDAQAALRLSPDGRRIAFVRQQDLYVAPLGGAARQLTRDGGGTVSNGLAEFIAQEEMHRFDGHWWSPDSAMLAFTRVDTAPIEISHRPEFDAGVLRAVTQRYPYAGRPNAEVRLGLVDVESGRTDWLDWQLAPDDYLARVQFAPDGSVVVQAQSRDQRRLAVRRFVDGRWEELLREGAHAWIDLDDDLTFAGGQWLRLADCRGRHSLYAGERPVDTGLGRVNRILAATAERAWITGWQDDPTEQHVYEVRLEDGDVRPVTEGAAWHEATVHAGAKRAAVVTARPDRQAELSIVDLGARARAAVTVLSDRVDGDHPYAPFLARHADADYGRLPGGGEALHYRLTRPAACEAGRRYPVVVHVYGGPGVQRVRRDYPSLQLQLLVQAGYGVFELDNRGSANRAAAFEKAIAGRLGKVEVEDQLRGLEYLRSLDWVDPQRIAIFGHSYGGYMTLMCLATAPDAFAAGVAVAPVTDWRLYDTHYTERYLGAPLDNEAGYTASSPLPFADRIAAPLLLIHGMADDNVLFTHSTLLMKALQDTGIPFELMTYPGSKHALQEPAVAAHRFQAILGFLHRVL